MNDQPVIAAERRVVRGKQVRALRQKGLVPATLYGHHLEPVSLQVERAGLEAILRNGGGSSLLRLKVGRERPLSVLIKQYQVHPVRQELLHVDFYGVSAGEKVKTRVPLRFVGQAPVAESHDVAVVRPLDQLTVECYPTDLPSHLEVDLSGLEELGSTIRVGDLVAGAGVTILDAAGEVVASAAATSKEIMGAPAEAPEGISEAQEEAAEDVTEEMRPAA